MARDTMFAIEPHAVTDQDHFTERGQLRGITKYRQFRAMLDDGRIEGGLSALFQPILSAEWSLDWGEAEPTDAMVEYAENAFLRKWGEHLEQILEYVPFGAQAVHPDWVRHDDGLMYPRIYYRRPETWLQFMADGNKVKALQVGGYAGNRYHNVTIPIEELTFFVRKRRSANDFTGRALLASAWESWSYKHKLFVIDGIAQERFATGVPWVELSDTADWDAYENMFAGIRSHERGFMMFKEGDLPRGSDSFGILEKARGESDLRGSIEMHNQEMLIAMLSQWLNLGVGEVGSRAVGEVHIDMALRQSDAVAKFVGEVFSVGDGETSPGVIATGMAINFGRSAPVPRLVANGITELSLPDLQTFVAGLASADMITYDEEIEAWIRRRAGIPAKPGSGDGSANQAPGQVDETQLRLAKHTGMHGIGREPTELERRVLRLADMVEVRESMQQQVEQRLREWVDRVRENARRYMEPRVRERDFEAIQNFRIVRKDELVDILVSAGTRALQEGRKEVAGELQRQVSGTDVEDIRDEMQAPESVQKEVALSLSKDDNGSVAYRLASGQAVPTAELATAELPKAATDWLDGQPVIRLAEGEPIDTSASLARIEAQARNAADAIANDVRKNIVDASIAAASEGRTLEGFDDLLERGGKRAISDAAAAVVGMGVAAGRDLAIESRATIEGETVELGRFVYSSVLDRNTCTVASDGSASNSCASLDGETAERRRDLTPVPNPRCAGGPALCRCIHIAEVL